jgi:isopenicillin-N epimerase
LRQSAVAAIFLGGALPANARDWKDYSATFSGSIDAHLPDGPLNPEDEAGWKTLAKNYDVTRRITNLENGYWGIMAQPVLAEYKRLTEFINQENTFFARLQWSETYGGIRETVAGFLSATESLQALIGILSVYEKALAANPRTKLLLLTHLNNLTGLIIPVAKISRIARERGVDVILDAAHSVGQVEFKLNTLGCDFIGVNLHKWVGAPIGYGVVYTKKERIDDIDPYRGKPSGPGDIGGRIDTGTLNFAAHMAIPAALAFHNKIGTAAKEARLRFLRNLWVGEARKLKGLTVLTPDDRNMVAALTSFRLDGVLPTKANDAVTRHLRENFGVLTIPRTGPDAGDCILVTPSVYTSSADVMKLATALRSITASPPSG